MIDSEIKPSEIIANSSTKHFVSETAISITANDDPDSDDGSGVVMLGPVERTSTVSISPPSDVDNGTSTESTSPPSDSDKGTLTVSNAPPSDINKGGSTGSTSPPSDMNKGGSTVSNAPPTDAANVDAANSPVTRKRRNRRQIRDDEVTALELALAQAKAKQAAYKREQAELAADTNALLSGRDLAGALLQKAVAAEDSAAVDVWVALTRRAAATDARRMEKMRAILSKRGHARREAARDQAAPGQREVDPGEASATP